MKNLTKQFNELATEMQKDALKNHNTELFQQISTLRGLMYDIKTEQYTAGADMVKNIVFKNN